MAAAIDDYVGQTSMRNSPAEHCALVTPSDSVDLVHASRGIAFVTAGALAIITVGGETVTIPSGALAAGAIHPVRATRIKSTGTTAANICVFW